MASAYCRTVKSVFAHTLTSVSLLLYFVCAPRRPNPNSFRPVIFVISSLLYAGMRFRLTALNVALV